MNGQAFLDWIKQPSTLKALVVAAGMAGIVIDPVMQEKILFIGGVIYAGLGAFYDQTPRKPVDPFDPVALEAKLSTEQIAAIVKLRRARINAVPPSS